MPQHLGRGARHLADGDGEVAIASWSREDDDGRFMGSGPLDPVILDHGVGEQLEAHLVELMSVTPLVMLDLDQLALAHIVDAREAEPSSA